MNKEQRAFVEYLMEYWVESLRSVAKIPAAAEAIAARRASFERLFPKESD